jgi:5'-nucleotidase
MRILLTNDDGIHAPGLAVLQKIAAQISDDVWVVAPESEQSGASHSLTLHLPLRLREAGPRLFALQGTPTDCVVMGVRHVLKDKPPDLVLSGVNRGANIADDVTYSGTVAGAMEGTALGIRSIALSQAYGEGPDRPTQWATAERHAPALLKKLVAAAWAPGTLLNVNFPDVEPDAVGGVDVTVQGRRDQSLLLVDARVDARHVPYYWLGFQRRAGQPAHGTDLKALMSGRISVTPLHLNLTDNIAHQALKSALS